MIRVRVPRQLAFTLSGGHPWVFREALASALRGVREPLETGDVVAIDDPDGNRIGLGLYDAESPIALRLYDRAPRGKLDPAWFVAATRRACETRRRWFDESTTAYRLMNGEGDRVPGLVMDRYGDVVVARTDGAAMALWFPRFADLLRSVLEAEGVRALVLRREASPGTQKFLEVWGSVGEPRVKVREHGMTFEVDLAEGQKTGAFLDQRENRRRVRALSKGLSVLNLFSYTGGFSVAAALGGASQVTSVDVAQRAHGTAQNSFRDNGLDPSKHRFVTADVFQFVASARARGEQFDLVISDPPSFAHNEKGKAKGLAAYAKLHREVSSLVSKGGLFGAASCSSHVDMEEFLKTLDDRALGRSDLSVVESFGPPSDHPTLAGAPEGRYLKFVWMARSAGAL